MSKWLFTVFFMFPLMGLGTARAQVENPRPQANRAMRPQPGELPVMGTVASVGVDRLTIKTADGKEQTILVSEQTRYREGQQELQLEDLKAGDHVVVRGEGSPDQALTALVVRRVTEDQMQRFGGAGGARAFGEIIAIEGNLLKLRTRQQGERVVKIDAQTTFMKDGQPSSLADLKVGDRIMVVGNDSGEGFTATRVMSGQMRRGRRGGGMRPGPMQ